MLLRLSQLYLFSRLTLILLTAPGFTGAEGQHDGKIINGTAVSPPHKYPWTAAFYYAGCFSDDFCPPSRQTCGASILNEYFILTAAHCCFLNGDDDVNQTIKGLFVLTGLHVREKLEPWSQNLSVAECIVHELFRFEGFLHDIALVRLNGKIEFSDKVTPVNLPSSSFEVDVDGELMASLIGWGLTNQTGIVYATELQELTLPLVTIDSCQRAYSFFNFLGKNSSFVVTENMLCAGFVVGGNTRGACTGDSGSPVMLKNPLTKTYTQVGITSWSSQPCGKSLQVSTRLSRYVSWINHHLQKCKPRAIN